MKTEWSRDRIESAFSHRNRAGMRPGKLALRRHSGWRNGAFIADGNPRGMPGAWRLALGYLAVLVAALPVLLWTGCMKNPMAGQHFAGVPSAHSRDAIPGSLPSPGEELWIVARDRSAGEQPTEDVPGSGALVAETDEGTEVPLPLKHTDVRAEVLGYIATVRVTQQFHNPFDAKIEAKYVFPLPHNAAVNEFVMAIGQRRIRGIIRERKEAEQIYEQAKRQGYVASLLTQERPNVFSQSVANLEPGKAIYIELNYFHTLAWVDGW